MATEAEAKETISESQHIVHGPFYEALHPDAVGMFDSSKGKILVETPIDSQHSLKETVSQHVNIVSEELTSKGHNNEAKDEKVSEVKEQLVSETVDGNVTTTDEEMTSDESTGNKVDAQAEDKQDEAQGVTDSQKLERVNEEMSIKLEHEARSVNDESTTGTDSISGAEPSQNENSREPVRMMTKEELILESPLDLVNEKPEVEKLDRVNEELHAKIEARTGILIDERTNDIDSMLVEEPSEKGNTQEPLEMTAKEDFELTKDEPEHGALESSLNAVHDEPEEFERVNEEKNAKIQGEARIVDDERASNDDSILVVEPSEKENKQESIDVAATRGLEPSEDIAEHDKLESLLDAVPEDIKGLEGKCEIQTMSKEELVVNVEERSLDGKKKCEPIDKAAFELRTVSENLQNMVSESSSETLIANKTNEKNTDDIEETTEACEMHETATIEEMSRDADGNIDQSVQEIEPENLEKVPETMLEDQSHKKFDDVETTNFDISEDGVNLKEEIDTSCTSKAAIEENTGKTMNTEETSKPDQPVEKNETKVRDDDTQNDEVVVKHEESPNSVWEDQAHETRISKDDTEISEFNEKTSGELELVSELVPEQKIQVTLTGTEDTQSENPNIDKSSSKEVSVVANPNEDAETVKEMTEANLHAVKDDHSESRTVIVPVLPDQIGEQEDAPKTESEGKFYEATYGKDNIEADTHEEKADSEELEVITILVVNDHNQEDVKPKETDNPDHMDNLDKANPEIADYSDDPGTTNVKDEDVLVKAISDVTGTHAFVAEAADEEVGKKHEDVHQITKNEDDKEAAVQKEKENLDINWVLGPEIQKDDMCETENAKIEKALSLDKDAISSDARVEIASDETSRLTLEETAVENIHAVESDDKLESSNVFETGEEEVLKKEESVDSTIASRSVNTTSAEVISENQIEGKEVTPVAANSEIFRGEEKHKLEEAITEVASRDQSKEIDGADDNRKNDTTIDEIFEMVEPNEDKENKKNEANENKNFYEHTLSVQEALKGEEGQKNGEGPSSVNEDQIHQPTYTKENIEVDISEAERETKQFKLMPESLPEDKWQKETGVFDAIKIDRSTNDDNPNTTISVVANANEDVETATENEEINLNTNKEDHSDSHRLISPVLSDQIGEHEKASTTERPEHIYQANNDERNIEVDIHKEKAQSEELEIIVESIPKDCNQDDVTEPKAENISNHSDDLQKEIPEISGQNSSPETAKVKDEDVLEKGICDVSDTHELVAETAYDRVDEKHEDAHQITNTEDNKEAAAQKEEENIDINSDLGPKPEDQRQDDVCEAERRVELTLNIDKDDKGSDMRAENASEATSGSDIRAENASEATSGLTLEETLAEKRYKLEYDDKTGSNMLEIRGEEVPMKEVFDACLEASSNVVSKEPIVVEVEQVSRQIMEEEVETNGTVEEVSLKQAKVAELVSQPDIETMDDNLYAKEASLDKKMQDVSVVVHQKIHSAEEDNSMEVGAVLENQTKEEKEIQIRLQKDETVDNQQEKENEAQAEQKSYESSNAGAIIENERSKDKETVENNSEEEKLEDNKPEKSPTVVLEDFETATGAKDSHESETYKQGTKDVSEEIFQKAEDTMLTESTIELGPGNQSNSSTHITEEEAAIPSKEALKEEVLGACLGVSSHVEIKEPIMAEVEHLSQQLTDKEGATNGTDKEAKDAELVSQTDIKTMGDTLHANEDSRDMNKQDASIEIEENIQNAQEDAGIEVSADSNNEAKEEKDAYTSLIKEDLKDMPKEKEIQTEQGSYKSSEAGETNEYESFRYKETAEDISKDIEDKDPEKLPHVIGDLETASEAKVIHVSETEKQSPEKNNKDFLKDEDMILVQSVPKLEHDNQNSKPIHSTEGPIPCAEASKEEVSNEYIEASANTSCNDPTAAEAKHLSQITEKEETTNGIDKEVNLKNAKDDELISRTDIETVGDSLYANETSHDKSMQDDSAVVEEKIRSSSEDKSIQTKGISENENKEKPDVQTSIQIDEPEDKKHEKVNELISQMDMETVGDSVCANEAFHDKHMQDAFVVVDEKIHSLSEDKSIETMVIPDNENKEEPGVKTRIQNDESKDKKQENDDEQISQTDMEIVGDSLYANEASHDKNMQDASVIVEKKIQSSSEDKSTELIPQTDVEIVGDSLYANEASHDNNMQDASVIVEEKIQSSSEDNSTEITGIPENENKEVPDVQTNIQDDEPEDKKQEKGDELTSQTDIETAGDSIYANEASRDKNMQDASEVVEEKLQSSSEDMSTETMNTLENENKEYLDVQTSIQKDEPEGNKQEKENEIQAEQKCNESQDASDTIENECLKEKVIAENISQKEMTDDQEAEKLPYVVHDDVETTTGAKAIDVTETEQESAENKNEENVQKCKDVMPVESVIELEYGNQSNNSIYSTEEAPIPSEEGVSSGDGLDETTVAEVKHLTWQMTEEEEETNGTDEEAKHAELFSQMDIQTMNNTSIANEASFDTNTQDDSEEIEESPHGKHKDGSTETRAISEIESNEEKDVHTSLQKEELVAKPPRKESELQKEQEANESNEASEKNENQSFKDKVSADNYSEKEKLEVQEPMKSPHVVLEDPETVTGTEDIHESETEKQRKENSNEENFQKVEDVILVEPTLKLEPDNQENKLNYTAEGDIPDEETLKVFNASIEVGSKIESTEPIVDEVEHLSQQMIKKEELIDEQAKEVEFVSQANTESMGDALYNIEASLSKNMQDASVVVDEQILGTPEDNSIEVRAVSQNGNKEEQGVHTVLQKEELEDKPIEKENEIQIMQKSYESCDVNETNKKENFKYKETEEYNLEKEILEDKEPEKSPHVIDEDLETKRTEGIHKSEAEKKGTENNSEEYFQKAGDLTVPELATAIEPGNQSNYSIHTTDIEIPNEEILKDDAFHACQGASSNTGTREPTIAEVEHLSQQIIDKDETSNDTDEKGKEVELVSEMNIETRTVPSLQANKASIDKNLQDSSLVVEEKIHSPSEDYSIEVMDFSKNENKEEQGVKENLHEEEQEDMPQENEIEIQAEQKSYELSNACKNIENESLKEKATAENNSVKEKLEDQEFESPNVVHEETETAIGIHESETEKQVAENNNGENFLQGEDMMFAESVTALDIGNEINKSIHTSEPEIPSEETLKEEAFDACQEISFNTRLGKPIVAEIKHLSQDIAAKEAATNRTNEVDKNGESVSQTDIEPMGDTSCSNEVSLETTMQETSEVVEENISMSDDNRIVVRAILEDENKEEHAVHTSLQEEDLEVKTQEKENGIPTEQKSYTLSDASETYGIKSFKEKESAANNSENEKLEDQEPEKSSQMVLEDLETANETEDIHGRETEKQDTESVIESEPDNTNNNSIHNTKGVAPIEEKTTRLIDDVAKADAHKGTRCNMLGGTSVTHELIEESKHMEGQGPILQKDSREIETHQKAEQSASTVTQNEVIADSTEILNTKLQKDVNEFMELDASADTLFRNQEIKIAKNIVSEEDTIETVYEQIQKDESEAKKDKLGTDSVPNNQDKENDCQSLKQTTTMMDSSGNLGTSSVVTSLADETEKEVDEKFSKISDYWPARYNEEASNVNVVDKEHQKEITSVKGEPFGIDKFTFTSDSTDASKLDACKEGREMLNEVSNLVSKEEIDEKIGSSTVLTEGKKNPQEESAMQKSEVKQPEVTETEKGISNASHEIKLENLQEEEDDLPVSQFLLKHILGEEGDTLNKNCEEEREDVTNKQDERDKKNDVDIPMQEETSKPEDNAGCEKLQNSYESPQTEESVDAENNSEGKVAKDDVSLQSALEGSTSKLAVIEGEIATVLSDKSVRTATDDSMELTSTEKIIPEIKLDGKPCNETDLAQDEKIQASIFEETVAEKDTQKVILQKESDEESKEQLQNVGSVEVSEDKIGEILKIGSEVVECGDEKQDVGTQIHISKKGSEEDLKLSKSQENKQTDLAIESTIHSLKRDENLMEDKNLAVMVETTDDKGGVNKTDEDKYGKEEMDEHKPEKSSNDATTTESPDSELKPIQKDDQTKKSFESSITNDSKLNEILELRSEDKNEESADKTQDVIDQNQGQKKNVTTEELKLSEPQIVQQSDPEMDEDHSVLSTESKVDEDKTDDENDEKEEEDEHKPEEPGHDAAITAEGRDAEVTPTKKKSRGILSGVGSKVKHSIAKVKKAITGKSSHSKTPSAK